MFDLKGQVIVVTGGAGRIGRAFVQCIAENQGIAIIADTDKEQGEKLKESLKHERLIGSVDAFKLDITSKNSIQALIQQVSEKYGHIDAVVNNAYPRNKNYGRSFFEVEYEDFCENVSLHLGGYFLVAQQMASYFENNNMEILSTLRLSMALQHHDLKFIQVRK